MGAWGWFVQVAEEASIYPLRLRGGLGLDGSSFEACAHALNFFLQKMLYGLHTAATGSIRMSTSPLSFPTPHFLTPLFSFPSYCQV